jgi:D-3-phosphoglycerate dehydrogenase
MMMTMTTTDPFPTERLADEDIRVLLLENIHADGRDFLRGKGFQVETVDHALGEDELIERIQGVHLLGIRSTTYITEKVLAAAPDLVAIGAFCIGTNQIDLAATTRRGIAVFNAPYSNTRSVVELAIGEIISLTRRLSDKNADMHAGIWNKSAAGSHEVRGRNLGIVGYGNIGSQLSVVAEALGLKVYFYDIDDKLALSNATRCSTIEELLQLSDIVTLHVDGRPGNAGLFGDEEMSLMRPGSIFLNLSRGIAVDTSSRGTSPVPRSTCSRSSPSVRATLSSPTCAGCATSSSRRTSAARRRRPSRTSAASWPRSCGRTPPSAAPP